MERLCVNHTHIQHNRSGYPSVEGFMRILAPGNLPFARRVSDAYGTDYIDNLEDFVKVVARSSKGVMTKRDVWNAISFGSPISLAEDEDSKGKDEWVADDDEDDIESISFSSEAEPQTPKPPPKRVLFSSPGEPEDFPSPFTMSVDDRIRILDANTRVVHSLASLISATHAGSDAEYHSMLRNATVPFVTAIRKTGPIEDLSPTPRPAVQPEHVGEEQFGVSQRLRMLGHDPNQLINVAKIGKRAIELYRGRFPGCVPPQRSVTNAHGHSYMMNLYTRTTAPHTVDVAIQEALQDTRPSAPKRSKN